MGFILKFKRHRLYPKNGSKSLVMHSLSWSLLSYKTKINLFPAIHDNCGLFSILLIFRHTLVGYIANNMDHCQTAPLYAVPNSHNNFRSGRVSQSVTGLAADASLTADPGVTISILAPYFHGD